MNKAKNYVGEDFMSVLFSSSLKRTFTFVFVTC